MSSSTSLLSLKMNILYGANTCSLQHFYWRPSPLYVANNKGSLTNIQIILCSSWLHFPGTMQEHKQVFFQRHFTYKCYIIDKV